MLLKVRAGQAEASPTGKPARVPAALAWILRLYSRMAASASLFRAAQWLAGIGGGLVSRKGWIRLPAFTGWGLAKDFPQPARRTFTQRFKASRGALPASQFTGGRDQPGEQNPALAESSTSMAAMSQPELVDRMEQEVLALGGAFVRCQADNLADKLSEQIRLFGGGRVWTWEAAAFPSGLLEALQSRGAELTQTGDEYILTGLTGCLAAAAETGTLALPGGPGMPLQASLLVENHLAVLRASRVRFSLEEILNMPEMRQASASALISGPSRTGDIELTLTVGVHGPKRIVIFCVEDG
jgi:L-lactate utilization protein LutC